MLPSSRFARPCLRLLGLLALPALLPSASFSASGPAALDDVVRLPEFKVFETRPVPPREQWDYLKVGNIEILSNASAGTAKRFARELAQFQHMLQVVAPTMLIRAEQPLMIVLCGKDGHYNRFVADGSQARRVKNVTFVRDVEIASIVVDYERRTVDVPDRTTLVSGPGGERIVAPLITPVGEIPALTMAEFSRQYVLLSLSEMTPRLPAWAAEGLATVYGAIEYSDKWIEIGSPKLFAHQIEEMMMVADLSAQVGSLTSRSSSGLGMEDAAVGMMPRTVYAYQRPQAIVPMPDLFAVGYEPRQRGGIAPDAMYANYQWRQQCAAFVHLCLYGFNGKFRQAFINFAARTSTEAPTEALFREHFGIGFKDMELRIRAHWSDGEFKGMRITSKEGGLLGPTTSTPFRPATDAEIGRIKGETLRLTGQEEAARQEFVTAYLRGERELQLLASLGLMARQRHDAPRARTYLEAVASAPAAVPRPRAYLELARLRAESMQSGPELPRYNPEATAALLTPLFQALKLPQKLSLVYREIAAVWAHSAVIPHRDHLNAIEQGARLFPYDVELSADLASLLVTHGYRADAEPYIERALKITRDPELRARLLKLRNPT